MERVQRKIGVAEHALGMALAPANLGAEDITPRVRKEVRKKSPVIANGSAPRAFIASPVVRGRPVGRPPGHTMLGSRG